MEGGEGEGRRKRELFTSICGGSQQKLHITCRLRIGSRLFRRRGPVLFPPHGALVDFRSACYGFDLVGLDLVASPGCRPRVVACVPAVPIATPISMFLGKVLSTQDIVKLQIIIDLCTKKAEISPLDRPVSFCSSQFIL